MRTGSARLLLYYRFIEDAFVGSLLLIIGGMITQPIEVVWYAPPTTGEERIDEVIGGLLVEVVVHDHVVHAPPPTPDGGIN